MLNIISAIIILILAFINVFKRNTLEKIEGWLLVIALILMNRIL